MARKLYFLIWVLSTLAIAFLAFMPDQMGRSIYAVIFPRGFYWAYLNAIQFGAHAVFFFFNCGILLLLLNTWRQISESQKFMVVFVWVALLTIVSEVGQMYFLPDDYNRSGLNLRDVVANFGGFFVAWMFYFILVKLLLGSRQLKRGF